MSKPYQKFVTELTLLRRFFCAFHLKKGLPERNITKGMYPSTQNVYKEPGSMT